MTRRDWELLLGLVGITGLSLAWGVHRGVMTIEQAGIVLRTIVMLFLAWMFIESVQ